MSRHQNQKINNLKLYFQKYGRNINTQYFIISVVVIRKILRLAGQKVPR